MTSPSQRGPSRLPAAYFAFSHLCLALAFVLLAVFSHKAAGFFYHPWMMVPVHLVTLGWLSASILGALYIIAPMALRSRLAEGRTDWAALIAFVCGLGGMLAHFWINSYGGMLWSACGVIFAFGWVGWRTVTALGKAKVALGVKLHLILAFVNVLGVAFLGVMMAFAKLGFPLWGLPLSNVYAHFHLAVLGWLLMMILGVAYRLLPMLIPTAIPHGVLPIASAVLLEVGTLCVVGGLVFAQPWLKIGSLFVVAAVASFAAVVGWMLRHRRPRAKGLPRLDLGLLHVAQAMVYLLVTLGLGLSFVFAPWDEVAQLRWIPVYAVCGLLGCAAQMILGVGGRLFPLYAWLTAFAESDFAQPPASPHGLTLRWLQASVLGLWTLGVPALAVGFLMQRPDWIVGASILLASAAVGSMTNVLRAARRARESIREALAEAE